MTAARFEPLEARSYCAKVTTPLDPTYHVDANAIRQVAGDDVHVYSAVPGTGGRTYVLAQTGSTLAIAAVLPDGTPDRAFGTRGVALTGRRTQSHLPGESPGVLKADAIGRLYFADNERVTRFHDDGTPDRSFGDGGTVRFTSDRRHVALADIAPTDAGVLVATTSTIDGVQRFSVQRIGRTTVKTVWSTRHDTGIRKLNANGYFADGPDQIIGAYYTSPEAARFAQSRGGLMLTRIERTDGPVSPTGKSRYDLVVTRFDTSGTTGVDLVRTDLRRPAGGAVHLQSVRLSPSGRVLEAVSEREVRQVSLRSREVQRFDAPPGGLGVTPIEVLASGDGIFTRSTAVAEKGGGYSWSIAKYTLDGNLDTTFADGGVAIVRSSQFADPRDELSQIFLDDSGRLNLLADTNAAPPTQTLARLG